MMMREKGGFDQDGSREVRGERWLDPRYLKVELMRFADGLNMVFGLKDSVVINQGLKAVARTDLGREDQIWTYIGFVYQTCTWLMSGHQFRRDI